MSAGEVLMNRALKLAAAGAATGAMVGGTINRARGGSFAKGATVGAVAGVEIGTGLHFVKDTDLIGRVKGLYRQVLEETEEAVERKAL